MGADEDFFDDAIWVENEIGGERLHVAIGFGRQHGGFAHWKFSAGAAHKSVQTGGGFLTDC